jgi:hypothetical protein
MKLELVFEGAPKVEQAFVDGQAIALGGAPATWRYQPEQDRWVLTVEMGDRLPATRAVLLEAAANELQQHVDGLRRRAAELGRTVSYDTAKSAMPVQHEVPEELKSAVVEARPVKPMRCPKCQSFSPKVRNVDPSTKITCSGPWHLPLEGCYCKPGTCQAPVIMGVQTRCLRREPGKLGAPIPLHQQLRAMADHYQNMVPVALPALLRGCGDLAEDLLKQAADEHQRALEVQHDAEVLSATIAGYESREQALKRANETLRETLENVEAERDSAAQARERWIEHCGKSNTELNAANTRLVEMGRGQQVLEDQLKALEAALVEREAAIKQAWAVITESFEAEEAQKLADAVAHALPPIPSAQSECAYCVTGTCPDHEAVVDAT